LLTASVASVGPSIFLDHLLELADLIRFQLALLSLPAVNCLFGYPDLEDKIFHRHLISACFKTDTICSVENPPELLTLRLEHFRRVTSIAAKFDFENA
jgi:hypothetical protein